MDELIKDKLYSFDEKVRVEIGPQIIELDCTDENLSNEVTHANYQIGTRDAFGKVIRYSELSDEVKKKTDNSMGVVNKGEKMSCVDWRGKLVPHLWKIYQMQETDEKDKKGNPISRFIKVNEVEGKDEALSIAKTIFEGME